MTRAAGRMGSVALGMRLAELRRAKGWSLQVLAGLVGTSGTHTSEIERGMDAPLPAHLARLATLFRVDADELAALLAEGASVGGHLGERAAR